MTEQPQKFYITTPIYYVNDRPHIGHIYTTTIADVIARYHRLRGDDTFFLTGTDEHGSKVAKAAEQQGQTPQEYADLIAGEFQQTFQRLDITNDDFIRTTQARHESRVAQYIQHLLDSGAVYLGEYEGWYDQGQEEYVTETNARAQDYKSAVNHRPLTRVTEKNYFFRLSAYGDQLLDILEKGEPFDVKPAARKNEVMARIRDGLNDVAISRSTEPWGITMPGDPDHSIYVWIDALLNYLTAIGDQGRNALWPADVHLIGKEILWFHAVIWPAMLLALGEALPKLVYAHSYWISEGQKMSKSLGNFVDLEKIDHYVDAFSLDALRYFLASNGPMSTTDSDFAESKFIDVYNADLANGIGNCFSRIANMTAKYFDGKLPEPELNSSSNEEPLNHASRLRRQVKAQVDTVQVEAMPNLNLAQVAECAAIIVRSVDAYIEQTAPFKLAKDPANLPQVGTILYNCAEAIRIASILLWSICPDKMETLWQRMNLDYAKTLADRGRGNLAAWTQWGLLEKDTPIEKGDALFPRYQLPKS